MCFNCPKAFQQNLNSLFACKRWGPAQIKIPGPLLSFGCPPCGWRWLHPVPWRVTGVEIREGEACRVDGASASNPVGWPAQPGRAVDTRVFWGLGSPAIQSIMGGVCHS